MRGLSIAGHDYIKKNKRLPKGRRVVQHFLQHTHPQWVISCLVGFLRAHEGFSVICRTGKSSGAGPATASSGHAAAGLEGRVAMELFVRKPLTGTWSIWQWHCSRRWFLGHSVCCRVYALSCTKKPLLKVGIGLCRVRGARAPDGLY